MAQSSSDNKLLREKMLAQMGIKPLWKLRCAPEKTSTEALEQTTFETEGILVKAPSQSVPSRSSQGISSAYAALKQTISPLPETQKALPEPVTLEQPQARSPVPSTQGMDWDALCHAVSACRACQLCEQRQNVVIGVGDQQADWMFIGEGPGAEEDLKGVPFVGQAGKLLDAMLASIGLKRGQGVYIANAVKCRPPHNRTPDVAEIAACRPYLERQIALVRPKLIIALGRPAAQTLLGGKELKIAASRGKVFHYSTPSTQTPLNLKIPVIVTYHPAYLLRTLADKSKAWEDLCFAQDQMAVQSSEDYS